MSRCSPLGSSGQAHLGQSKPPSSWFITNSARTPSAGVNRCSSSSDCSRARLVFSCTSVTGGLLSRRRCSCSPRGAWCQRWLSAWHDAARHFFAERWHRLPRCIRFSCGSSVQLLLVSSAGGAFRCSHWCLARQRPLRHDRTGSPSPSSPTAKATADAAAAARQELFRRHVLHHCPSRSGHDRDIAIHACHCRSFCSMTSRRPLPAALAGQQRTGCSTRLVSSRVTGHHINGVTSGALPCLPPRADSSRHVESGHAAQRHHGKEGGRPTASRTSPDSVRTRWVAGSSGPPRILVGFHLPRIRAGAAPVMHDCFLWPVLMILDRGHRRSQPPIQDHRWGLGVGARAWHLLGLRTRR